MWHADADMEICRYPMHRILPKHIWDLLAETFESHWLLKKLIS